MATSTSISPATTELSKVERAQISPLPSQPAVSPTPDEAPAAFTEIWQEATSDNTFTLHGFRRFRTSHLLNLRFLEREIDKLDHRFFQAGLRLEQPDRPLNKLGLDHAKVDEIDINAITTITVKQADFDRLQELISQYDQALISYNQIMRMETFSLADNLASACRREDLNPYEVYKTRLVKADVPLRRPRTPLLSFTHTTLRAFWYHVRQRATFHTTSSSLESQNHSTGPMTYQNTIKMAEFIASFLTALGSGVFLIIPLCILSFQHGKAAHLVTVSISIVVFSIAISLTIRTSGPETIAASAAYAAVLVVFLSNSPD